MSHISNTSASHLLFGRLISVSISVSGLFALGLISTDQRLGGLFGNEPLDLSPCATSLLHERRQRHFSNSNLLQGPNQFSCKKIREYIEANLNLALRATKSPAVENKHITSPHTTAR